MKSTFGGRSLLKYHFASGLELHSYNAAPGQDGGGGSRVFPEGL